MAEARAPYAHLFDGVRTRELRLRMLEETYQQARAAIAAQGWEAEWGEDAYLIIFAHGLAYVRGELARELPDATDDALRAECERLRGEWMAAEAQYAVMKFRAYTLTEENQRLRWSLTACERQLALAEQRLAQFRADERALKAQLAAQARPQEPTPLQEQRVAEPAPQEGRGRGHWLGRFWQWLRGRRT
jgi:hypothetical protein